jgi:hypothetical protein
MGGGGHYSKKVENMWVKYKVQYIGCEVKIIN